MFLITFTRNQVKDRFLSFSVEEIKINSFKVTIVTDNFLSKYIPGSNGFSIIESPLVFSPDFGNTIFSQTNYDKDENVLSIFKSTISGRPIYYHLNSKGEFFCSTHISMLRKAGVPIQENSEMLPEFFVYRYVMPPNTLYKNIQQVVTGSRLRIKLVDGRCKIVLINQYNPPLPNKENNSIDNISRHMLTFLNESIQALNPYKDRLSVLLSGGLDSTILFKICQNNFEINTTFSTGYPFEDPKVNQEKEYALSAADAFRTKHRYYESTTIEYLYGFLKAISMAEEPIHHLQSVMFYLLFSDGIPKTRDIIVSGQGADGVFGLDLHNFLFRSEKKIYKQLSKYPFKKLLEFLSRITDRGERYLPICDAKNILWSLGAYGSEDWVCQHFKITKQDIISGRYEAVKSFEHRSLYDIISILDFFGDISITQSIWSKLGESQHKIIYYPFNNINTLNFIYSTPWDVKLRSPKNVLRVVARQLEIPDFIITRRKRGFGIRNEFWSGKGGIFEPLVPLASKVFDEKQIRDMQSLEPKKAMTFWNMLNYAIWKRLCINNEPLELLVEELKECILQKISL